jgi:hypothetical protein
LCRPPCIGMRIAIPMSGKKLLNFGKGPLSTARHK